MPSSLRFPRFAFAAVGVALIAGITAAGPAGASGDTWLDAPAPPATLPGDPPLKIDLIDGLPRRGGGLAAPSLDVRGSAPIGDRDGATQLDYDISWQHGAGDAGGAALRLGAHGEGLKLRQAMVLPATAGAVWTRLDTFALIDVPGNGHSLRIGDAVTRPGSAGLARRFAGLQWGTDRRLDAAHDARFVPQAIGTTADGTVPRTVDLLLAQARERIAPTVAGADAWRYLPAVIGNGEVLIAAADPLGRLQWLNLPLVVAPALLPAGTSSYSASLGWERQRYGIASNEYGSALAQGTWRHGITGDFTGELQADVDDRSATLIAAGTAPVGRLGVLTVNATQAREAGMQQSLVGASFGHHGKDYGVAATAQWRRSPSAAAPTVVDDAVLPRREIAARASLAVGGVALAAAGVVRDHDDDTHASLFSASVATKLLDDGTFAISAVHARLGAPVNGVMVSVRLPLGPRVRAAPAVIPGLGGRFDFGGDGPGRDARGF